MNKNIRMGLTLLVPLAIISLGFQIENRGPSKSQRASDQQRARAQSSSLTPFLGGPISGITVEEFELFQIGLDDFLEVEDPEEGLGPVFNGRSCAECHAIPRIGGSGTILEQRAGVRHADGSFEELPGGSNFQLFSIPVHSVQAAIPAEANVVARRKSLPLFGSGLVEAIPEETLLALEDPEDLDGDGISGRAARVFDRATGEVLVGRFGWKSQQAKLITFGAEAYRDEMGITNDLFPFEACPYGVDCELLEFLDPVADPEDGPERTTGLRGIDNFESFLLFIGPPPRGEITPLVEDGHQIFRQLNCQGCHTESFTTGQVDSPALSNRQFSPFGDFLLHDIGSGDGIGQADALPEEIRTPPLWGLRFRGPFFHDGRASNLEEAIQLHGGEAERSREGFEALSEDERKALIAFLRSL